MTSQTNPFVRGYDNLSIRRVLLITHDDDCPALYRPLHPSQAQLPDWEVQQSPCVFCEDFALVTDGQVISDDLYTQCRDAGLVRALLYEITAPSFGTLFHVGDHHSLESAQQVVALHVKPDKMPELKRETFTA